MLDMMDIVGKLASFSREFLQAEQCWRASDYNSCPFPCNSPAELNFRVLRRERNDLLKLCSL